jgi:hypothetical protein
MMITDSSATVLGSDAGNSAAGERPNFASLRTDESNGLEYITDVATRKRLYKLPQCEICGVTPWVFTVDLSPNHACRVHASDRRERNDNEHMANPGAF